MKENEDFVHVADRSAWVLDGATGLTPQQIFPGRGSDAAQFVRLIHQTLQSRVRDSSVTLDQAVGETILTARAKITRLTAGLTIDPADMPAAALALARVRGASLDLFVLGDCRVILTDHLGLSIDLTDCHLAPLDGAVIQQMAKLIRSGMGWRAAREAVHPMLLKHRRMMNTEEGYWCVSTDPTAAAHGRLLHVPLSGKPLHVIMMSDGFDRLLHFRRFQTPQSLLRYVEHHGLESALRELRRLEDEDPECRQYPRIKPKDDASAVYLRVIAD